MSVLRKHSTALRGVSTMGSPFTLNEVFKSTGTPVIASNSFSSRYKGALVSCRTVCTRAVPST